MYIKLNQNNRVIEILSNSFDLSEKIKLQNSQKIKLFNMIAYRYEQIGQKNKAIEMLSLSFEMLKNEGDNYVTAWAMGEIAAEYEKLNQKDKAAHILSRAFSVIKNIENKNEQNYAISKIAETYNKLEQKDKIPKILSKCFEPAIPMNINRYVPGQALKIIQSVGTIKYEIALKQINDMQGLKFKSWAIIGLAEQYVKSGQKNKTEEILCQTIISIKSMPDTYQKVLGLIKIADIYAESGQKIDPGIKKILSGIIAEVESNPGKDTLDVEEKKVDLYLF